MTALPLAVEDQQLRILGVHRSRLRPGEIGVDLFAGGGGYSEGYAWAVGQPPAVAVNHDANAIAMHTLNHPEAEHYLEDVFHVDPIPTVRGRLVGVLHGSPDCTHFSRAKGDVPKSKKIRGLAWAIVRWSSEVSPRIVSLENVEEFITWGPLCADGRPIKARAGETFKAFVAMISTGLAADHPAYDDMRFALVGDPGTRCDRHKSRRRMGCPNCTRRDADYPRMPIERYEALVARCIKGLGYDLAWRTLRACDYGSPTSRKRLYVVGRRDGDPIRWPVPTHGPRGTLPYRTAAECIDWLDEAGNSNLGVSIFATPEEARALGVKRPLADATLRRIAEGIRRYVLENLNPFLVPYHSARRESETPRTHPVDAPLPTQTVENRFAVVTPTMLSNNTNNAPHSAQEPIGAITTGGRHAVVAPILTPAHSHGWDRNGGPSTPADKPLGTVVAKDGKALVAPQLLHLSHGGVNDVIDKPLRTITATPKGGDNALVAPQLLNITHGGRPEAIDEPFKTITAAHRGEKAVVAPILARTAHGEADKNGVKRRGRGAHPVDESLPTVTGSNDLAVIAPTLIQTSYGEREGQAPRVLDLHEPLGTVVAGGQKHALVETIMGHEAEAAAFLNNHFTGNSGNDLQEPLPTATAREHLTLGVAHITKYYGDSGQQPGSKMDEPLSTITASDHNALVAAHITKFNTGSVGASMEEPLPTITGGGGAARPAGAAHGLGVVAAHVITHNGQSIGSNAEAPLPVVTASGGGHQGVVATHITKFNGTSEHGAAIDEPLHTVTSGGEKGGGHHGVAAVHLEKFYGEGGQWHGAGEPMHTVTTKERIALVAAFLRRFNIVTDDKPYVMVTIGGETFVLYDIAMRMLQPRELARAQGFPDSYKLVGNKSQQVARIGNSVCPHVAQAIVRANLDGEGEELCA